MVFWGNLLTEIQKFQEVFNNTNRSNRLCFILVSTRPNFEEHFNISATKHSNINAWLKLALCYETNS